MARFEAEIAGSSATQVGIYAATGSRSVAGLSDWRLWFTGISPPSRQYEYITCVSPCRLALAGELSIDRAAT